MMSGHFVFPDTVSLIFAPIEVPHAITPMIVQTPSFR